MIPYEELVLALEDWRSRQGLGTPSTRSARASAPVAVPAAPFVPPPPPQLPGRQSGAYAAAASASTAVVTNARPVLDDYSDGEAGTEIREGGLEGGLEDEIDVDAEAVDVIDEQLEDE